MRDLILAKEFVEGQRKSGQQVHLAKKEIRGKGVWYIVYIGSFPNPAKAARYIKQKKVKEFFPGCFIRKLSR
jgi:septal ring-binding cell division protein DamX